MANRCVNTNHAFFFRSGTPGAEDRIPNSILLKAIGDEFYKLPYEILGMPNSAYSSSTILLKTCEIEKKSPLKQNLA
jgi:hypothetical protein